MKFGDLHHEMNDEHLGNEEAEGNGGNKRRNRLILAVRSRSRVQRWTRVVNTARVRLTIV